MRKAIEWRNWRTLFGLNKIRSRNQSRDNPSTKQDYQVVASIKSSCWKSFKDNRRWLEYHWLTWNSPWIEFKKSSRYFTQKGTKIIIPEINHIQPSTSVGNKSICWKRSKNNIFTKRPTTIIIKPLSSHFGQQSNRSRGVLRTIKEIPEYKQKLLSDFILDWQLPTTTYPIPGKRKRQIKKSSQHQSSSVLIDGIKWHKISYDGIKVI